jgi:hypothetical protein
LTTLKKIFLSAVVVFSFTTAFPQQMFSIASDIGFQQNLKKDQSFWTLGHTTNALFHLTPKDGIYTWFSYYTNGRFKNDLTAVAKSPLTNPQQIPYTNSTRMRLKHFSVGWRRYLKGTPDAESSWNLYSQVGFGLLLGRVDNIHSTVIDTTVYSVPVRSGKGNFKRLTLDLGIGFEYPIAGDFYFYTEGKVWVPTTSYPSKFIFVNNNAPYVVMLGAGVRILF